jgi:ubiquinone/menaquinone biosynthesis C-methylase UbiE
MGRYSKARMFNRKAGRKTSKADEILKSLGIQPGQVIADIGAGGGFFSFLFSYAVGESGKVYAVDTNRDFLEYIDKQAREMKRANIEIVRATEQSVPLPEHSIDLVFIRNVYHHLTNRTGYFIKIKELLRPHESLLLNIHTKDRDSVSIDAVAIMFPRKSSLTR